ncbi:MAG TPA: PRC-barrel domain-containing protein [Solirubrobacteraceae bacterium]|nr:PRC-barrel domain-containing protein [Solirubrobacteraceae bacterium]
MDLGDPISYLVLAEGTPVLTSDGERLGEVRRVLAEVEEDIFDGLIVRTGDGDRFVDADQVGRLYERGVALPFSREEAAHLPDPAGNPPALAVDPDDTASEPAGRKIGDAARKVWDRISGNY